MSLLWDITKAFGFGLIAFWAAPVIAALLPWRYARKVTTTYQSMAMSLLGRAIMLQRSHGGLKLKKSVYDAAFEAEKVRVGGELLYFRDPHDYMRTFRGHPFGLAHESLAAIVDARTAHLARSFRELVQDSRFEREDGAFKAFFAIEPGKRSLVNLADIKAVVGKSASPTMADRVDAYAEKSQSLFDSSNKVEQAMWLMALGAGFGLMWLAKEAGNVSVGGGSGGSVVPIFVGVLPF